MSNKKIYWKGIEEFTKDSGFVKYSGREFSEYLPTSESFNTSRRDFLKMMGFSVAAVSLSACETPVKKAIPYLNKPVDVDPGIPNYYASTYMNSGNYCSIVVKTREGRPIKIQGNKICPITQGGVSLEVEASVLSLYDNERLKCPNIKGNSSTWEKLDSNIINSLSDISNIGGNIRIISNTILSPSTKRAIDIFINKYPSTKHVVYDQQSFYGILSSNKFSFNTSLIPSYDFSKANIIVSFGADFLGTWLSPIEFTKQYTVNRKLSFGKKNMSRHYQFESNFSLTGANADYRFALKPSKESDTILALYNVLAKQLGKPILRAPKISNSEKIFKVAKDLWDNRGKSLVVSSSNNPDVQVLVNAINYLLNNYGKTIFLDSPVNYKQGNDYLMNSFVDDLENSKISAVIFFESNPVYDYPEGFKISNLLSKVKLKISISDRFNETSSFVDYVAPSHHYLESWNDCNPKLGIYSLSQPVITPLFNTRNSVENFLIWSDYSNKNYYSFIKNEWETNLFPKQNKINNFQGFWDKCLFNGVYCDFSTDKSLGHVNFLADLSVISKNIVSNFNKNVNFADSIELCLYEKVSIRTGGQANNPWLQEMPDPISKACWDNYLTIPQSLARKYGIEMNEGKTKMVKLNISNKSLKIPVLVQPGQADNTVGISIGYGREKSGRVSNGVGINVYPLKVKKNGIYWDNLVKDNVTIEPLNETYRIAQTQTHETYMGRKSVIQESTLSKYKKNPLSGRYFPKIFTSKGYKKPEDISLWKGHSYSNHHWGMVIDLNSCTGCGVCTIACQAENNIPVVGKDEVLNRREMHWIRIDRYYSSDGKDAKSLEVPSNNPEVVFQPMMCQHCNNAPCETVCPVLATTHSSEGLNQMTYNRCIGTRYCANNCPYKVRRFNWFKYHDNKQFQDNVSMNTSLGKMVLNPDVTVRSRGVMEKCTMCIQRIQAGKLKAKLEKRKLRDGDISVACADSCPADAIVFGDMNNNESSIFKLLSSEVEGRAYHVLEELSVKPNVTYLTKIRNKEKIL